MKERPPQVTAHHLARRAAVYARQSSPRQVLENEGSAAHQRAQAQYARAWGWAEEDIDLIDVDLGRSGASSANRAGYQQLCAGIESGAIGAVFASDLSRLGRNAIELLTFLNSCRAHNVLLVLNGTVCDLSSSGQLFGQQVTTLVAEYENVRRTEMMQTGRRARVQSGKTVTGPPTGYIRAQKGVWQVHPDAAVFEALRAVFRVFLQKRALVPTMRELRRLRIKVPSRRSGGIVEFKEATVALIVRILHNPAYCGIYQFPQRRIDPTRGRTQAGRSRLRRATPEESIVLHDHHPALVSEAEWEEAQRILALNAPAKARRHLGPGSALLQGIVKCDRHGSAMSVHYFPSRRDGDSSHAYKCNGDLFEDGQPCMNISGVRLDRAVIGELAKRLSAPRLTALRDAWRRAQANAISEGRRKHIEVHNARQTEEDLRRRLFQVSPETRLVAEEYERRLEEAIRYRKHVEEAASIEPSEVQKFTDERWNELLGISQDLPALLAAKHVSNRDRKQLIRTQVLCVIAEEQTPEVQRARIVWADGGPDTGVEIKLGPYAHREMERLAAEGLSPAEIAAELNRQGILTTQWNPWSKETVRQALRLKRKAKSDKAA